MKGEKEGREEERKRAQESTLSLFFSGAKVYKKPREGKKKTSLSSFLLFFSFPSLREFRSLLFAYSFSSSLPSSSECGLWVIAFLKQPWRGRRNEDSSSHPDLCFLSPSNRPIQPSLLFNSQWLSFLPFLLTSPSFHIRLSRSLSLSFCSAVRFGVNNKYKKGARRRKGGPGWADFSGFDKIA